jgi:hypothetical protein
MSSRVTRQELPIHDNGKLRSGYGQPRAHDVNPQVRLRRRFGARVAEVDGFGRAEMPVLAGVPLRVGADGRAPNRAAVCQAVDPCDRIQQGE